MRKSINKILTSVICFSLISAGIPSIGTYAQPTTMFDMTDSITAEAGKQISVDIYARDLSASFDTLALMLEYDTPITLTKVESKLPGYVNFKNHSYDNHNSSYIQIITPTAVEADKDSVIATLYFDISEKASYGDVYSINWTNPSSYNFLFVDSFKSKKNIDYCFDNGCTVSISNSSNLSDTSKNITTLNIDDQKGSPGEKIKVKIYSTGKEVDVNTIAVLFDYDSHLKLEKVESPLKGLITETTRTSNELTSSYIQLAMPDTIKASEKMVLAELTFIIPPDAEFGYIYDIVWRNPSSYNGFIFKNTGKDNNNISCRFENGTINVYDPEVTTSTTDTTTTFDPVAFTTNTPVSSTPLVSTTKVPVSSAPAVSTTNAPVYASAPVTSTTKASVPSPDDVDGNGVLNTTDILKLKQSILNPSLKINAMSGADMNKDGKINVMDLIRLLRLFLN